MRAPLDPAAVRIYTVPPPEFEEIAILDASSRGSLVFGAQAETNVMIDRLKREAAALGANGVLLEMTDTEANGGLSVGGGSGGYHSALGVGVSGAITNKVGRGIAIYVARDGPAR